MRSFCGMSECIAATLSWPWAMSMAETWSASLRVRVKIITLW